MKKRIGKKGMESEMIGWWILGVSTLGLMIWIYIDLKLKNTSAIEYIKNLFRFGR